MKKTGSESPPEDRSRDAQASSDRADEAPLELLERVRLQAEVARQRVRLAREELKRARKRVKEAKREARNARKRAASARKEWKRARKQARRNDVKLDRPVVSTVLA